MADEPRRPKDDDETPSNPPTGESEVAGADWLISQLDAAPTGQFDTRQAPEGAGEGPGRAGDNPVLAWWRQKLVAADSLVNPEPRTVGEDADVKGQGVQSGETARDDAGHHDAGPTDARPAPVDEPVEPARPEPEQFTPRRSKQAEPESPADAEAAFLPEPAFIRQPTFEPEPAWTPPVADRDDEDVDDDDTVRGWSLSADGPLDIEPDEDLEDEAETGLIPSLAPPLFKPRSARDLLADEDGDEEDLPVPPAGAADEPTEALPAVPMPAQRAAQTPAPQRDERAEPDAESPPEYVTEDLDNFSWKLTPNDQLDPRIHRDAPAGSTAAEGPGAVDAVTFDGAENSADTGGEAPAGRASRLEAEQDAHPETVALPTDRPQKPAGDESGPRRRTFTGVPPGSEPASPAIPPAFSVLPTATKPRRPLRPARPTTTRASRPVVLAAIGIVALLVLGGLFFLGSQLPALLAGPAPTPSASPSAAATATPEPTAPAAPVGPAAPGEQEWTALGGGECIEPYSTPWAETFTVIDCGEAHTAQLVFTGAVDDDPAAAYPGEDEILQQIYLWCSAPGVLDSEAAAEYPDLQVQGAYPVSEEQWADGQRNYYCFVSRSSGEPLSGSVAAPQG